MQSESRKIHTLLYYYQVPVCRGDGAK